MEMQTDELGAELHTLEQDVGALRQEIQTLESELHDLKEESRTLQKSVDKEKSLLSSIKSAHKRRAINDENIPPMVQHSYFHDSISQYFQVRNDFEPKPVKNVDIDDMCLGATLKARKIIALKENILYENLYRLGGVTAFPLIDELFLGLRFDKFQRLTKSFGKPDYVILQKQAVDTKSKGPQYLRRVHKHTISQEIVSVEARNINPDGLEESQIPVFAQRIHRVLTRIVYVSDVLQTLHQLKMSDIGGVSNKEVFQEVGADDSRNHIHFVFISDGTSLRLDIEVRDRVVNVLCKAMEANRGFKGSLSSLMGIKLSDLEVEVQQFMKTLYEQNKIETS